MHGVNAQDELGIEGLKQVLFRDLHKSRSEFFELHHHGTAIHKVDIGKYSCCECCYIQCSHYDNVLYILPESRKYYKETCPLCVFKVDKKCNRFWNCCINKMSVQQAFNTVNEAVSFENNCFHF